jgi:hypothetical protein
MYFKSFIALKAKVTSVQFLTICFLKVDFTNRKFYHSLHTVEEK